MPLVAGVDSSTQNTKVLIVDSESGDLVASARAAHEVSGTGGARETHPAVWWKALAEAFAATGRGNEIRALSIAGQQHGMVASDVSGPLRPAPLWNDTRSAVDARHLIDRFGGPTWWAEKIGVVPVASFTVTKWLWLVRTDPELAARTTSIRLPHDWLTEKVTGQGVTDRGDASGTGWWSTATGDYDHEILEACGLDPSTLPVVLGPRDVAGEVHKEAARHLGVPAGIPVGPGTGDNMAAALGLGLHAGTPVISLGTSGTAYAVSTSRTSDPTGTVAGFADATDRFLPLAATLNCTLAVDRIAGWLGLDRNVAAIDTNVVVLPFLDGERTPDLPNAAGTITGLRHSTTGEEILLAAYRGAVASLLDALDRIDDVGSGIDSGAPVVLIGGGARGVVWQRVVAAMSGKRIVVPHSDELVATGAAVQAAAVLEGGEPGEIARRFDSGRGQEVPAVPLDVAARERIREVVAASRILNTGERLNSGG
jgi:xylulokinase